MNGVAICSISKPSIWTTQTATATRTFLLIGLPLTALEVPTKISYIENPWMSHALSWFPAGLVVDLSYVSSTYPELAPDYYCLEVAAGTNEAGSKLLEQPVPNRCLEVRKYMPSFPRCPLTSRDLSS